MIEFDLSELVKDCAPLPVAEKPKYQALEKMRELQELGLEWIAVKMRDKLLLAEKMECIAREKYPVITPAKIKSFLEKKAARYNEEVVKNHKGNLRQKSLRAAAIGHPLSTGSGIIISEGLFYTSGTNWFESGGSSTQKTQTSSSSSGEPIYALTNDFLSSEKDRISGFVWDEVKIKDYKAVPPDHALAALKSARAKEIFDEFTIASVTKMKDPLLLGRLNGTEDRYFLAQWGDDVALDDVI